MYIYEFQPEIVMFYVIMTNIINKIADLSACVLMHELMHLHKKKKKKSFIPISYFIVHYMNES